MKNKIKKIMRTWILTGILLTGLCLIRTSCPVSAAQENNKTLTLEQAKNLAVAASTGYEQIEGKIATQEAALKSAVKSIAAKQKDRSSFRYSPLFNLKFPTKAEFSEAYQEEYKPLQIQSQLDSLNHKLSDQKLTEYNKVYKLFVSIYTNQKKIEYNQERLDALQTKLEKTRILLQTGNAKKSDVEKMESTVKKLNTELSSQMKQLEQDKKSLSTAIDLDVTTGYDFENPYVQTTLDRSMLDSLKEYALNHDQTYYDAALDASLAKMAVETDYKLLSAYYKRSDVNIISGYINQVLSGQKISSRAFKKSYDEFLEAIDKPWAGDYKIHLLFITIRIPKEWLKGERDGIRYIEDEPYALYEACLDYQDKRLAQEAAEQELRQKVETSFDTYVNVKNAYLSYVEQAAEAKEQLDRELILNRIGEMTYEEYESSAESCEQLQMDMLDSLSDYSDSLYDLDRLTCGAVSAYLENTDTDLFSVGSGSAYVEEELKAGPYYYIQPLVEQQLFELHISLPDQFEPQITDFELWCDNVQIGARTPVSKALRHLMISTEKIDSCKIRFYNADTFVCDCEIDPYQYSGALSIIADVRTEKVEELQIGSYTVTSESETGRIILKLTPDEKEGIASFRLETEDGKSIGGEEKQEIGKPFYYLDVLKNSLDTVVIHFYDESGNELYKGHFNVTNSVLVKDPS